MRGEVRPSFFMVLGRVGAHGVSTPVRFAADYVRGPRGSQRREQDVRDEVRTVVGRLRDGRFVGRDGRVGA